MTAYVAGRISIGQVLLMQNAYMRAIVVGSRDILAVLITIGVSSGSSISLYIDPVRLLSTLKDVEDGAYHLKRR